MFLRYLTYDQMKILAWVVIVGGFLFWMEFARRWSKSIDEYFDSPELDFPDEITIEIVKENPEPKKPDASHTETSSAPSGCNDKDRS